MPDPEPSLAFILNLRGDTSACPSPAPITTVAPPHPTPPPPSCRAPINRHAVHVAAVHLVIKRPSDPSLGGVGKGPDVDLAYAWPRGRRLLTSPSIPSLSPLLFPLIFFPSSHYNDGLPSCGSLELAGGTEGSVEGEGFKLISRCETRLPPGLNRRNKLVFSTAELRGLPPHPRPPFSLCPGFYKRSLKSSRCHLHRGNRWLATVPRRLRRDQRSDGCRPRDHQSLSEHPDSSLRAGALFFFSLFWRNGGVFGVGDSAGAPVALIY